MSTDSSSISSRSSLIHPGAFIRTLAAPLIVWVVMIAVVTFAGQPGVICVTPMAWLLALWCGGQYIRLAGEVSERQSLLGPALLGAALGLCMSVLFILVSSFALPVGSDSGEVRKAIVLDVIIGVGGILACAAMSTFTGWLTLNRLRRQ